MHYKDSIEARYLVFRTPDPRVGQGVKLYMFSLLAGRCVWQILALGANGIISDVQTPTHSKPLYRDHLRHCQQLRLANFRWCPLKDVKEKTFSVKNSGFPKQMWRQHRNQSTNWKFTIASGSRPRQRAIFVPNPGPICRFLARAGAGLLFELRAISDNKELQHCSGCN